MPTEEQHAWLQTALGVAGDLTQTAEDTASDVAETAEDTASSTVQSVESTASVVAETAENAVASAADAASDTASSALDTVEDAASTIGETAEDAASGIVETAEDTVSAVAQTAEDTVSNAAETVADTASDIAQTAEDAVSTVVGAIEDAGSNLLQQATDAGQTEAGAGDAGAGEAGATDGGADAGGASPCGESPTFTTSSPVPVDVLADSVIEFNNKMNAALGGNPHMQPKFGWNFEFDARGLVSKANLTVDTQIVRPRWSGGRVSDKERALINKAVELIKAHEERHRDIARNAMNLAVCATHGKTEAVATKALNDAFKKMDQAQNALDAREGQMSIVLDGNGQPSDVVLVGAKSP